MMLLSEAAVATKGKVLGQDTLFFSVGTDSRATSPGQLFVALRGENFDGHTFTRQCLDQGAVAAMVSVEQELPAAVLVKDTKLALGDLAAHWRNKFAIPVAAITGSNGKTTVKEMLASILRSQAGDADTVLATQGNLNNDIGLPLTLLQLREHHRHAVVEMGMSHAGEIGYLSGLARPTVALVNNATSAHLGGLGSVEAIAKAKGEIFSGLAGDGVAVINVDDAFAPLWQELAAGSRVMTFALEHPADVTAQYQLHADGSDVQLQTAQGRVSFHLAVPGLHNIRNALAAATVALAMNISLEVIASGLASFGGVKGRLQLKNGINGALVIDDTYNANPASMKAAIDVLAARSGEKLMVLGDMGELGADAAQMHFDIGQYAAKAGINALYALGDLSREAVKGFGQDAHHYDSPETLAADLLPHMGRQTVVLVKGSRFMRMERVVALITDKDSNAQGEKH
jgi:UDP-N-acetylmuramoyl-tripeptide--D-alanyl-D-alanine ligase